MPIHLYETLFLIDSGKLASDGDTIRAALHNALTKYGSEIVVSRDWDDRKLAYPIRTAGVTHKKGAYYTVYYNMESTKQQSLEDDLRIGMTDYLIRHMTSHVDPKYAEVMLDIARNDQSKGFCLRGMQEEAAPTELSGINDPGMGGGFEGGFGVGFEGGGSGGDRAGGDRAAGGDRPPPRGPRPPRRDDAKPE